MQLRAYDASKAGQSLGVAALLAVLRFTALGRQIRATVGNRDLGQRCQGNSSCLPLCPVQAKYSALKTLDELTVARFDEEIEVVAAARSFLHNQVRGIVGTLERVGAGFAAGRDFDLKPILEPFAPLKKYLTVVSGLGDLMSVLTDQSANEPIRVLEAAPGR